MRLVLYSNHLNWNGAFPCLFLMINSEKPLIEKTSWTELKGVAGIRFNVLVKMGKNEVVSVDSLYKICQTLSCDIEEILEFVN